LRFNFRELDDESCKELAGVLESEEILAPKSAGLYFDRAFRNSRGATLVFQSIGANLTIFQNVLELHTSDYCLKTDFFQALSTTLNSNALPCLENLSLRRTRIPADVLATLLGCLAQSACAHTLRCLILSDCGIRVEGAKVLGLAIERDSLPSLQKLDISSNKLGKDGVTYVTQGLQASLTKLTDLNLKDVDMDDAGHKCLTDTIQSGALEKLGLGISGMIF